jgi:beta-glucosidase-like glycosyl hydrolase
MKNKGIRICFLYVLFFFITSCIGIKNNKEKVVFSNIHTEIDDFVIDKSQKPPTLFEISIEGRKWVDSVYNGITFDEKVGQLFMVAAYSNKDNAHYDTIEKLIVENKIGGLIFFQGGPGCQANVTNWYQSKAKTQLFIGNDAELGLSMRLDSTYTYPWNMTLGEVQDMKLIEKLGAQMGDQSKRLGLQFNFSPVLDINTNPKNPIIGFRSFGEDKYKVTERAIALMKGLQGKGVFSTGKHFPGHGNTETDSHKGLPTINFSKQRLEVMELYPYKKMFEEGLASVMVAHLSVPSLESKPNVPSSISYNIVTNVLQKELGFQGLIFTDALNMKAVSKFSTPGQIDLLAFMAGNDILLFPENVPLSLDVFKQAYQDSLFSDSRLAFSVKKILKFKYYAGLNTYKPIGTKNLYTDLNSSKNKALNYELYENAKTVLKNTNIIIPIKDLANQRIAYLKMGDAANSAFLSTLKKYTEVTEIADDILESLQTKLNQFTTVIIGYHKSDIAWKDFDFSEAELRKLAFLAENNTVILDVFASPYSLKPISSFTDVEGVVVSYQNSSIAQEVSAELIFGAIGSKGKLPVTVTTDFTANIGFTTEKLNVL